MVASMEKLQIPEDSYIKTDALFTKLTKLEKLKDKKVKVSYIRLFFKDILIAFKLGKKDCS